MSVSHPIPTKLLAHTNCKSVVTLSSGHPICTDLVSVGEDVHCEFVKEKAHPEYRQEASRLVIESGQPIAHVAKEIGVAEGILGKWVKLDRERRGVARKSH